MLRFISIDNYTLIAHLEVEFRRGLNLITGETGSGKSILVDAVGLLVGARASQEMVREGFDLARVEGIFSRIGGQRPYHSERDFPYRGKSSVHKWASVYFEPTARVG